MATYQKEYEHKLKEVFEERYAHPNMTQEELMQVPRFAREIQEKLAGVLESPENPWLPMQAASTSLMDEMGVVSQFFFKLQYYLMTFISQHDSPDPALVRERRDYDMVLPLIRNLVQKDDNLVVAEPTEKREMARPTLGKIVRWFKTMTTNETVARMQSFFLHGRPERITS